MSDSGKEKLAWPPKKDDLERLYLAEHLSASKIAKAYGLNYAKEKTAESTVLYHLKRNGIIRRDRAEHVRRVTKEMVDEWVTRYQSGESLKQIAGKLVVPTTVFVKLRDRGVKLRNKVEAQIEATTKYHRESFLGDAIEQAYLVGLRYGDLNVVIHGRAVRVRVSTTHPAMADLFEGLFAPYGHVHRYPRSSRLTGYEWSLECDLDSTFQFLIQKPAISGLSSLSEKETLAFVAGIVDVEGSIHLHNKRGRYNPEISITNTDSSLINYLSDKLNCLGFHAQVSWHTQDYDRKGIRGKSNVGRLVLWRFLEVQRLLKSLALRHPEKIAKAILAYRLRYWSSTEEKTELLEDWHKLLESIRGDRDQFVEAARAAIAAKTNNKDEMG